MQDTYTYICTSQPLDLYVRTSCILIRVALELCHQLQQKHISVMCVCRVVSCLREKKSLVNGDAHLLSQFVSV